MSGCCLQPLVHEYPANTDLTTIPRLKHRKNITALYQVPNVYGRFTHSFQVGSQSKGVALRLFPRYSQRTISKRDKASYSTRAYPSVTPLWYSTQTISTVPHRTPVIRSPRYRIKTRSTFRTIQRPEAESTDSNSCASYTANYHHSDLVDSYVYSPLELPFDDRLSSHLNILHGEASNTFTFVQEPTDPHPSVVPQNNDTDRGVTLLVPSTLAVPTVHPEACADNYSASGSATRFTKTTPSGGRVARDVFALR
jgi:hypothetical protein